ncbi:hypothetical protein BDR22DRAFT_191081 [Usnea florida]
MRFTKSMTFESLTLSPLSPNLSDHGRSKIWFHQAKIQRLRQSRALGEVNSHPHPSHRTSLASKMFKDMTASSNKSIPDRDIQKLDKNATVIPVGLDLGPSWVGASFTLETDHCPCSIGIPGSQVYKDFYSETLSMAVQHHLDFEEPSLPLPVAMVSSESRASSLKRVFAEHISDLLRKLGRMEDRLHFKVMAITVPSHWDISARTVVAKAAELAGHPLDGQHMVVKLPRAIQSAFKMCRENHGTYHTLVVNYHKTHLHLMIAQMRGTSFVMQREVWLPYLGEDGIRDALRASTKRVDDETCTDGFLGVEAHNAEPIIMDNETPHSEIDFYRRDSVATTPRKPITKDPPNPILTNESSAVPHCTQGHLPPQHSTLPNPQPTNAHHANHQPILNALHKFIHLMPPPTSTSHSSPSPPISRYVLSDITYIVVCGDATPHSQQALLTAIRITYTQHSDIRLRACPCNCGSYGAEIAARRQWQNPMRVGVWEGGL